MWQIHQSVWTQRFMYQRVELNVDDMPIHRTGESRKVPFLIKKNDFPKRTFVLGRPLNLEVDRNG